MSFQAVSSQLCQQMSFLPSLHPEAGADSQEGPWGSHTPPQPEGAGCTDSELPVIHLQVFQVGHQAEDSTVILRLAALKVGDGSDRTKQLRQGLRGTSLDLSEKDKLDVDSTRQVPGQHRTCGYRARAPVLWRPGAKKARKASASWSFRSMVIPLVQTDRGRVPKPAAKGLWLLEPQVTSSREPGSATIPA